MGYWEIIYKFMFEIPRVVLDTIVIAVILNQ